MGTGRVYVLAFLSWRKSPTNSPLADARAVAIETASIALAPSLLLFEVPSNLIISWSILLWDELSRPFSLGPMTPLTLRTAFCTPFPWNLFGSPSRSSRTSSLPFEAPEGTLALPTASVVITSASTVGFPRESSTCLALTATIFIGRTTTTPITPSRPVKVFSGGRPSNA